MTLRDYFAAKAMQGFAADQYCDNGAQAAKPLTVGRRHACGACQMSALVDLFEVKPQHMSCRHIAYSPIKRALPYVEAANGSYTHRVRNAALHHLEGYSPHVSVSCWCGMSLNIGGRRTVGSKFVAVPSLGRPVCATCEGRAIGAGLEDSHKINGRMVRFQPQTRRAA